MHSVYPLQAVSGPELAGALGNVAAPPPSPLHDRVRARGRVVDTRDSRAGREQGEMPRVGRADLHARCQPRRSIQRALQPSGHGSSGRLAARSLPMNQDAMVPAMYPKIAKP